MINILFMCEKSTNKILVLFLLVLVGLLDILNELFAQMFSRPHGKNLLFQVYLSRCY